MAFLVGPDTVDTISTDVLCAYPAKELGGSPVVSPNIFINEEQVEFYTTSTLPDPTEGVPLPTNVIPLPCQPGNRVIVANVNTSVFFNGQLPAVQGDKAQLLGTDRPLVGPFYYEDVHIGTGVV